jgi:NAD(P)-dependent dehydrogenase (short-subunit alcohol dehydrogenase family)
VQFVRVAAIFSTLKMRPSEEIPLDEWRQVLDVNITGVMLGCRAGESPTTAMALDRQIDRAWNIWRQAAYSTNPGADCTGGPAS